MTGVQTCALPISDIARRLVAANVLFARLDGQTIGLVPLGVLRYTDDATRYPARVLVPGREKSCMRPPSTEGDAEPLGVADRDVRAELPRRSQESQSQKVGRDGDDGAGFLGFGTEGFVVLDSAVGGRIGDDDTEEILFLDRKSTRLNSSHMSESRMPSSA